MDFNNGVQYNGQHNDVPYIAHEGILARQERTIRRLWVLCMLIFVSLFSALVITNGVWIYYEHQWATETTVVTQESEDGGTNNYIGEDGEITNGQSETNDNQNETRPKGWWK